MDDRLREIDARLRALESVVADLGARLARIDRLPSAAPAGPVVSTAVPAATTGDSAASPFEVLSLTGRTLIVLGGAVLLRALTESGQVPAGPGVALGLLYAVGWYAAADRAARVGRRRSAIAHGAGAAAIALPLVWEASRKFALLDATSGALTLGLVTAVGLLVAARRDLAVVAAMAGGGATLLALALAPATGEWSPFAILATLLWLSFWAGGATRPSWRWLSWPPAVAGALLGAGIIVRAAATPPHETLTATVVSQLVLVVAAGLAVGWRTLARREPAGVFEIAIAALALGVGVGGALHTTSAGARGVFVAIGLACLLASSAIYGLALAFVRRRQGHRVNYVFYTATALTLLIVGIGVLFDGAAVGVTVAVLALAATGFGWRATLPMLTLHGAILCLVAVSTSGWLAAGRIWVTGADAWLAITPAAWFALAATVACLLTPRPETWDPPASVASAGRSLVALLVVACGATAVTLAVGPLLLSTPLDAGSLASWKTAVLAGTAMAAAWATRHARVMEVGAFVYALFVAGGVKLVVEDFRVSSPSTLFAALAVFGAALVVAPRLRRAPLKSAAS